MRHRQVTFLGYTFRSRKVRTRAGKYFFSVNPAISDEAGKRIRRQIRSWRLHRGPNRWLILLPAADAYRGRDQRRSAGVEAEAEAPVGL